MKVGNKVTDVQLEEKGWTKSDERFGGYQIWTNEDERILWDKDRQKVVIIYSVSNGSNQEVSAV